MNCTFDNFIRLDANKTALQIIDDYLLTIHTKGCHQPLIIYSEKSNGKTHLLEAIKNKLQSIYPLYRIRFISFDILRKEIQKTNTSISRILPTMHLEENDILLFDDFQEIPRREILTRILGEELFKTYYSGGRIIIASNRLPQTMWGAMYYMKDLFVASPIACIHSPILFRDYFALEAYYRSRYYQTIPLEFLVKVKKETASFQEFEKAVSDYTGIIYLNDNY